MTPSDPKITVPSRQQRFMPDAPCAPPTAGMRIVRTLALFLVLLIAVAVEGALAASPRAEIDSLLSFVGRQQGIEFVRNGTAHTATEAESHLRKKLMRGGGRIKTAEDFIKYCATRSSFTGVPYRVRYAEGHERKAADVLHEELRRVRRADTN